MTPLLLPLLLLASLLTLSSAATLPTHLNPRAAYPSNTTCLCSERAPLDYTISLWIIGKTTDEDGALSQGLRDNFATFCQGYYVLWSSTVPIATNRATGESFPAETAPTTLGGHVNTGFVDLVVTGYVVGIDLEGKKYDGCLSKVVERSEEMSVSCDCGK